MHSLRYSQKIPLSLEDSWNFFSSPTNLKNLTPEYLSFQITNETGKDKMYAGQIISYIIRPLWNLPLEWITEITHVEEPLYFIDEQRFGPYKFWHHEHHFKPIPHGVEMTDIVYYQLSLGIIGRAIHFLKVKRDLEGIFAYRHAKLEKLFGPYAEN